MGIIICKNCGWENPDSIRCCEKCGEVINNNVSAKFCPSYQVENAPNRFENNKYGWNWPAFIFGGIWAALHKIYWPLIIQVLLFVGIFIGCIMPAEESNTDSDLPFFGATLLLLFWVSIVINIILGCRGNAILHGKPMLKQYDINDLLRKRFNWLSFFSGGLNLVVTSKKWLAFSPILFFISFVCSMLGSQDYYFIIISLAFMIGLISYPIMGFIGGLKTNRIIAQDATDNKSASQKYNISRTISIVWILFIVWWVPIILECIE